MDRNNIQIDGMTEDVMPLEPLAEKYRAFNWHVLEVDGHNITEFVRAIDEAKAIYEKPTLIIAHTIPGKACRKLNLIIAGTASRRRVRKESDFSKKFAR